jgi:hypothetical protein
VTAGEAPKAVEEKYVISGQELWIHTIKVPYRDHQGRIVGVLGIFEDITDRRRAEETLQQRRLELQHLAETLEERVKERTAELADLSSQLVSIKHSVTIWEGSFVKIDWKKCITRIDIHRKNLLFSLSRYGGLIKR